MLVLLVVVAGVTAIVRLAAAEQLSEVRLVNALGEAAAFVRRALRSRWLVAALIFGAGAASGWVAARAWTSARTRRMPLIIADLRHANVPFADGVAHVRRYATAPVADDAAAIWLILQQASRGRLTMWRRAAANTLWRVSSRQVHALATRLSEAPSDVPAVQWTGFMLLAAELERVWPSRVRLGAAWKGEGERS